MLTQQGLLTFVSRQLFSGDNGQLQKSLAVKFRFNLANKNFQLKMSKLLIIFLILIAQSNLKFYGPT